jgi:hypothetical protein
MSNAEIGDAYSRLKEIREDFIRELFRDREEGNDSEFEDSLIPEGIFELCNSEILEFLLQEREARGGEIYQWYETRYVALGIGLSIIERKITEFILRKFGNSRRIVEVGAGVGQCSLLLAACGVDVSPIESSEDHFDMMERLSRRISEKIHDIEGHFSPVEGLYPDVSEEAIDGDPSILLFPSLSWTQSEEEEAESMRAMRKSEGVIISLEHHFRQRDDEEKQELIDRIMREGFGEPEEVFSWEDWGFGFRPDRIVYMKNEGSLDE